MNNQPKKFFGDVTENMSGEISKVISDEDVRSFAVATTDTNPLHLDDEYAKTSVFGQRISHGILVSGLISAVFGREFPGPGWIYVKQTLNFKAPVYIDDEVTARVRVTKLIPKKKFVEFKTECLVGEKVVLEGEATLMSPRRQKAD